jgi:preprotein translocase subunit SecY
MEELPRPRSKIYVLEPLLRRMPEIAVPKRHVSFKEKFLWTVLALILFFIMAQIPLYGMVGDPKEWLGQLRIIFASQMGTLMELGIGPIVTAGIILQLLVGSKVINLDLTNPEDRAMFTSTQKFLAITMGIFQGSMLVLAGQYGVGLDSARGLFILFQLALGATIVIFLDEIVSKYGFGSGVSLFIAGGVAMTIFWQAVNPATGVIPSFIGGLAGGEGFIDAFFGPAAGGLNMLGLVATLLVFFIVVYVESMRVEIPIAYGKFGGIRGRYPIKFLYTSNIPVILAMTVFANFRIISAVTGAEWLVYYTSAPTGLGAVMADPLHMVIYTTILVGMAIGFGWLWVHMTGMGPRDVAMQLDRSDMLIPGFRRDIRVMERVLGRYIIPTAILGAAFVGFISAGADALGALGTGTGILLTVGIVHSLYQQIAREQVSEMFPAVRRLIGE